MKRFMWFPVIASIFIGAECQLAVSQNPRRDFPQQSVDSQSLPELNTAKIVEVAEVNREIDEKTALNLVWKLPQVRRKARQIERLSRGSIKVGAVVYASPTPDEPYYKIRIFENQPDHDSTIYWFRVSSTSGVVEVLDVIENKYISLDEWRSQLKR